MTSAPVFAAALLICSVPAFAQKKNDSPADSPGARSTEVASSEPWRILPEQPADANAGKTAMDRLRIDQYKIHQFSMHDRNGQFYVLVPNDPWALPLGGQPTDATTCYNIRTYVVARDSKDSDSTHPVSYSTCQPASRYGLKKTEEK
jgi:hypothetical protein